MLLVYLVLVGICFVIYQFRMRRERSARGLRKYFRDYIVLAFFLGLIAVFFYLRRVRLATLTAPPVVTSIDDLDDYPVGTPVRVVGTVSEQMPTPFRTYVAYIREAALGANDVETPELLIQTQDDAVLINNDTYGEWEWDKEVVDEADYFHIEQQDQVLVYAYVDDLTDELAEVNADFVYLGSVEAFNAMVARMMRLPTIMAVVSLMSSLIALLLPFAYYWRFQQREAQIV